MKLLEFVDYLLDPNKLSNFYREQGLRPEAVEEHGVAIYVVGSAIEIEADIRLFTSDQTNSLIEVRIDSIDYVYVLEIDIAIDLIISDAGLVTNLDKANLIVQYAIYDA